MKIDHLLSALRLYERRTPADPPPVTNRRAPPRWRTSSVAYRCAEAAVRAHSHLTPPRPSSSSTSSQPPVPTPDEPKTGFIKKDGNVSQACTRKCSGERGAVPCAKVRKIRVRRYFTGRLHYFLICIQHTGKRGGTEGISWAPEQKQNKIKHLVLYKSKCLN